LLEVQRLRGESAWLRIQLDIHRTEHVTSQPEGPSTAVN
jgi:hypothetical protein